MPKPPDIPPEVREQFVAAVVVAKNQVYPGGNCPFTIQPSVIHGILGPEFSVTVREETPLINERLAEIVSPHVPIVLFTLRSLLASLADLREAVQKREEQDGGDSLVRVGS